MFKNQHGFWSWQGNYASWHNYYLYIAFAITIIALLLISMFRFKIRNWWSNKQRWFFVFKKEDHFWRFIGFLIVLVQIIRLIFFLDYVNRWELLSLHLCRLHILVLGLMLMFKLKNKVKFMMIMASIGVIFAFVFGNLSTGDKFNEIMADPANANKAWTWDQVVNIKELSHTEKLMLVHGFKFYNVGPDNFFFWEYFFAHMAIVIIPAFIWVANHQKMSLKEFFAMQLVYLGLAIMAWGFDWATAGLQDTRWNANLWYIGTNADNDMSSALGWLSAWPQNLITYAGVLGVIVTWTLYMIINLFSNLVWFEEGKIVRVKHSQQWIWFKRDFRKIVLRKK